jgi:hypothetical protein
VKWAQAVKVLGAGLLELYVIAHNADNVRLLPHRFFEIAEGGHECFNIILLEIFRDGNARTLVQFLEAVAGSFFFISGKVCLSAFLRVNPL